MNRIAIPSSARFGVRVQAKGPYMAPPSRLLTVQANLAEDPPDKVPSGSDSVPESPMEPSKDFMKALDRRLGEKPLPGVDSPDMKSKNPTEATGTPTRKFGEALSRRISRSSDDDLSPNVETLVTDSMGRKPPAPDPLDMPATAQNTPAIRGMRNRNELTFDISKERYREYRRVVFDFDYWANTRSSSRFFFNMLTLPVSRIMKDIFPPTLTVTLWAAMIVADVPQTIVSALGITIPQWLATGTKVAADPATLTGSILVVLVIFRTNNAYLRFDEARKMWGLLLNRSRDIVRQCVSFFPEGDMQRKATFARWTIALSQSLKCHLRPGYSEDLKDDLGKVLSAEEMDLLMTADHKPLLCMQVLSEMVEDADITMYQKRQMQKEITIFEDILGGCERLLRTPIPVSYTRHSTRCIMIWLLTFPIWLQLQIGPALIPTTALVAFLLLGMEEIGVENEEPFSILPLEVIANKAKADIIELFNKQVQNRETSAIEYIYTSDNNIFENV